MIAVARLVVMLLAWCAVGCRPVGMSPTTTAAVGLASTVGAAAINRAITGGCYAMCSTGYHCDHKDGLCHPNVAVDKNKPPSSVQTPATLVASTSTSSATVSPATSAEPATSNQLPTAQGLTETPESSSADADAEIAEPPSSAKPKAPSGSQGTACRPPFRCALEQGR